MADNTFSQPLSNGASWQPEEEAAQHIEIGHRFMVAGQFERAAHFFRAAVALEPHNPDAHGRLAIALLELGQLAEADAVSVLALAMWPDLTPILQVRGAVLRALGRLEEGTELLRRVALAHPERSALTGFLGGVLYEEGRFEEATDAALTTLDRDPEDWRALLLLALCLVAQTPNLRDAIAGNATLKSATVQSVDLQSAVLKHRREVNAVMQRALQLAPNEGMTHAVLGACYAQSHQPEAARQFLETALQLEPENALAAHWIRVLDDARKASN